MKKGIIIGIIIVILIGLGVLTLRFLSGEDNWICQNGDWVKHGNPKAEKPNVPCGNNNMKEIDENTQSAEEQNIVVFEPKGDSNITSPFDVEGKARVFENVVSLRLKSKSGKILFQGVTDAKSPDVGQFGLFQEEITFETKEKEGVLEVFQASPKDGSDTDKVTIPVKFGQDENEE